MSKPLKILYFSWLREKTGLALEEFLLPDGVNTVAKLIESLIARDANYAAAFNDCNRVRCAINQELAYPWSPLQPGDEVAFFPPVTGG